MDAVWIRESYVVYLVLELGREGGEWEYPLFGQWFVRDSLALRTGFEFLRGPG